MAEDLPPGLSRTKPSDPDSDLPPGLSRTKGGPTGEPGGALSAFGGGVAHGLGDIVWGAGQLGTHLLPGGYEGSLAERMDKAAAERDKAYQQDPTRSAHPFAAGVGEIGGEIVATLPLDWIPGLAPAAIAGRGAQIAGRLGAGARAAGTAGRYARGVVKGAEIGALEPETGKDGYWGQKAGDVALGAGGGALGEAVTGRLGAAIAPRLSPAAQTLAQEGVRLTPGLAMQSPRLMGGEGARRVEEILKSVWPLGEAIRHGQQTSIQDFNTATINRVLRQIGAQELDRGTYGRDAIGRMQDAISAEYTRVLTPLTWTADPDFYRNVGFQFLGAGQGIMRLQGQNMLNPMTRLITKDLQDQFETIFRQHVLSRMDPNTGSMPGLMLKQVESELGQYAKSFQHSPDGYQRLLGESIRDLQEEIRDSLERTNPSSAIDLQNVNTAYAMAQRVNQAAASRGAVTGADQGVFRATDLLNAVRAQDPTRMKNAFARGRAMFQPWAEAAQSILRGTMPDSGTAERLITIDRMMRILSGAGRAGLGYGAYAFGGLPGLAAGTVAAGAYTRPGMSALTRYLAAPSGWRTGLRTAVQGDISSRIADPALAAILTGNPSLDELTQ